MPQHGPAGATGAGGIPCESRGRCCIMAGPRCCIIPGWPIIGWGIIPGNIPGRGPAKHHQGGRGGPTKLKISDHTCVARCPHPRYGLRTHAGVHASGRGHARHERRAHHAWRHAWRHPVVSRRRTAHGVEHHCWQLVCASNPEDDFTEGNFSLPKVLELLSLSAQIEPA